MIQQQQVSEDPEPNTSEIKIIQVLNELANKVTFIFIYIYTILYICIYYIYLYLFFTMNEINKLFPSFIPLFLHKEISTFSSELMEVSALQCQLNTALKSMLKEKNEYA